MADEEQFSLCWNNFNSNLSAGFHESLCRGDLVDVTLAAEGQLVKAHRLVLSVCSPYFRKMFTQMPANQHAFVFLKDVSHTALKDLIQFMYCGEVNVRQEALPTFISTAEALQIKGLTETGEPSTSATNISASGATTLATGSHPSPIKVITSGAGSSASASSAQNNHSPNRQPRIVQQRRAATVFKVEQSEDSSDDKPIVVQQKRTSQRINLNSNVQQPATKRQRANDSSAATSTATLEDGTTATIVHVQESSQHPQIVQLQMQQPIAQQGQIISTISMSTDDKLQDTEFIDIHGDLPTKSEPEYGDDLGDVETIEQDPDQDMDAEHDPDQDDEQADQEQDHDDGDGEEDATYVEDESYGDLKYDDSYFTENDETKAGTSAFSDSYADGAVAETSGTDAQDVKKLLPIVERAEKRMVAIADAPKPVSNVPIKTRSKAWKEEVPSAVEPAVESSPVRRSSVAVVSKHKLPGMVRLNVENPVYVLKSELMAIYVPKIDLYTARLAELVFGKDTLIASTWNSLEGLDEYLLNAVINNVMRLFQTKAPTEQTIRIYIVKHVSQLQNANHTQ